jgi:hypothetical protein
MNPTLRFALVAILGALAAGLVLYGLVFVGSYDFIVRQARSFYWLNSQIAATIAAILSALVAWPIFRALATATAGRSSDTDKMILLATVALCIASAYVHRFKFFSKDSDPLFICAPAHPDDAASIEHLGEGESEGRRCVPLTKENTAIAHAIDRQKSPKPLEIDSLERFSKITWFKNGAPAIYYGTLVNEHGMPKLFDGPGFDPDSPDFLRPATVQVINDLRERQRATDASHTAKRAGALEAARRASEAEAASRRDADERERRAEEQRRAQEAEKASREKQIAERAEAERREELRQEEERRTWRSSELEITSDTWSFQNNQAWINITVRNRTGESLGLKWGERPRGMFTVSVEGDIFNDCGGVYSLNASGFPFNMDQPRWLRPGESTSVTIRGVKSAGQNCRLVSTNFTIDIFSADGSKRTAAGASLQLRP